MWCTNNGGGLAHAGNRVRRARRNVTQRFTALRVAEGQAQAPFRLDFYRCPSGGGVHVKPAVQPAPAWPLRVCPPQLTATSSRSATAAPRRPS